MKFRKLIFTATLAAITTVSAMASSPSTTTTVLQDLIQKLNINLSDLEDETLKIKFMINEKNEMIILGTDDKKMDSYIKSSLNYQKVDAADLKPYNVYIVPVTFQEA